MYRQCDMPRKYNTVLHFHEKVEFLRLWNMYEYIDCPGGLKYLKIELLFFSYVYRFFITYFYCLKVRFTFLFQCMQIIKCNTKARSVYEANVPETLKELKELLPVDSLFVFVFYFSACKSWVIAKLERFTKPTFLRDSAVLKLIHRWMFLFVQNMVKLITCFHEFWNHESTIFSRNFIVLFSTRKKIPLRLKTKKMPVWPV